MDANYVIRNFKTTVCPAWLDGKCLNTEEECIAMHAPIPERRPPVLIYGRHSYKPIHCRNLVNGIMCNEGDACQFAHSKLEILYHPTIYKTRMCEFDTDQYGNCAKYGKFCCKAHSEAEIRTAEDFAATTAIKPVQFQTETLEDSHMNMMRYYKRSMCTSRPCQCEGFSAHRMEELRRDDTLYEPRPCPNYYIDRKWVFKPRTTLCDPMLCKKAHSRMEVIYHPIYFKTEICRNFLLNNCRFGKHCAHAHGTRDLCLPLLQTYSSCMLLSSSPSSDPPPSDSALSSLRTLAV
jgi:hypothetical protein